MTATEIITLINNSSSLDEVFPNLGNWSETYKEFAKAIHPDICSVKGSNEAITRLNALRDELMNGRKGKDDAGEYIYNFEQVRFTGDPKLLKLSFENYRMLMMKKDEHSMFFKKYLPDVGSIMNDGSIIYRITERVVPLTDALSYFKGEIPQIHVNWILNRMLEFSCFMAQNGITHCGLTPESIFIVPKFHGIMVSSFYHLVRKGSRVQTISGKYKNFYPSFLFQKDNPKQASSIIDIECAMRIAVYLLGDSSGNGAKLRKTHNNELLNFYTSKHGTAPETLQAHKDLVAKFFPKEFHVLTI